MLRPSKKEREQQIDFAMRLEALTLSEKTYSESHNIIEHAKQYYHFLKGNES